MAPEIETRFREIEMRMDRCEAVTKMHDQMYRLKQEENGNANLLWEAQIDKVEHSVRSFEKRLMVLETDYASAKVQIEHELPLTQKLCTKQLKKYVEKKFTELQQNS